MTTPIEAKRMKAFGKRLSDVRKSRNITQQELAERLGVSLVSIGYIETGRRWPRLNTLHNIAEVLDVPIDQLFKGLQ